MISDGVCQNMLMAANQLGRICRQSSLTQLVQVSPVPLESTNAALMPRQAHKKANIGPESLFVALSHALSHLCGSLTHVRLSHSPNERQEHFQLSTRIARCSANARWVASYSTRPTFWGQHPASLL